MGYFSHKHIFDTQVTKLKRNVIISRGRTAENVFDEQRGWPENSIIPMCRDSRSYFFPNVLIDASS